MCNMHKMEKREKEKKEFLPKPDGKVRKFTKIHARKFSLLCRILEYTSYKSSKVKSLVQLICIEFVDLKGRLK